MCRARSSSASHQLVDKMSGTKWSLKLGTNNYSNHANDESDETLPRRLCYHKRHILMRSNMKKSVSDEYLKSAKNQTLHLVEKKIHFEDLSFKRQIVFLH